MLSKFLLMACLMAAANCGVFEISSPGFAAYSGYPTPPPPSRPLATGAGAGQHPPQQQQQPPQQLSPQPPVHPIHHLGSKPQLLPEHHHQQQLQQFHQRPIYRPPYLHQYHPAAPIALSPIHPIAPTYSPVLPVPVAHPAVVPVPVSHPQVAISPIATPVVNHIPQHTIPIYANAHPHYQFHYGVSDPLTGDIKSQHEERDGDLVKGQYSLLQPDGITRIVHYTADATGFHAQVTYSGAGAHPNVPVGHVLAKPLPTPVLQPLAGLPALAAYTPKPLHPVY